MMKKKNMDYFFNPKSVAVVGASHNPLKIGHVILKNFVYGGFDGKIYPINPNPEPILGLQTYTSVKKLQKRIDLAVIAIPAKAVPKVMRECGEAKIKAVCVITGGFREIGGEGEKLESELRKIIKKYNMTVIGPNCLGVYDSKSEVDMLFLPSYRLGRPTKGPIAFLSQSGAFGSAILDWSAQEGFGMSKFISYGNAIDVDEVALLEYLGSDKASKVISMYIEGAHRAKELMKVAEKITRKKPVLCLKAGRSKAGTKAVYSHTGSLAGSDKIYSAAFKQCGIMRVDTTEEMFDYARALACQPLPKGKRIAIITDGGGFGVMASDFAEEHGLELSSFSKETVKRLRKATTPYASLHNPIDLTGSADGDMYKAAIEACMEDKSVDSVLVILLFQPPNIESDVITALLELNAKYNKPMLVCSAGGTYTQLHRDILERSGIPTFSTPERIVKSIAALYRYSRIKKKPI